MSVPTNFVTRLNLAGGDETAMLVFLSPTGPVKDGAVTTEEVIRLIVSNRTLREMASLLARRIAELDARPAPPEVKPKPTPVVAERRALAEDGPDDHAAFPMLQ